MPVRPSLSGGIAGGNKSSPAFFAGIIALGVFAYWLFKNKDEPQTAADAPTKNPFPLLPLG